MYLIREIYRNNHKSSPFIQNLLKKQICSFEILWPNYPPPSMQIFQNLLLDSYLHVLAEIPPIADFLKSTTGQLFKLPTCACRNPPWPPVCRFSQICHWTVAYKCLQKSQPPTYMSLFCHCLGDLFCNFIIV